MGPTLVAFLLGWLLCVKVAIAQDASSPHINLSECQGYRVSDTRANTTTSITAELTLAGKACDVFGVDIEKLILEVTYETDSRLHVKIQDAGTQVYQVPQAVFPRPESQNLAENDSLLHFHFVPDPFSFQVCRKDTGEVIFDTSGLQLIFESQYLRLRTKLPEDPNLYGLGYHTDSFRLNTTGYRRTLWNADSYRVPEETNLYSSHPIYIDHRPNGTHGVFLLNSNGMDVAVDNSEEDGQYLEYNTLGGVLDFYFFAGPTPIEVSKQYSEVAGLPAMIPYWSLGFQQCRWGYRDIYEVAEVVTNYSRAEIPLETMYTDIDYMDRRRVFTNDPDRYPMEKMRELVSYLHSHNQKYIVMVDPAVAYAPHPPFERGVEDSIFLMDPHHEGEIWQGVVWPGVAAFPDWFHENVTEYWNGEFEIFFNPQEGVDVDGLWIDMNEAANPFCDFPCDDPEVQAVDYPPEPPLVRDPERPIPGFSCAFQPDGTQCEEFVDEGGSTQRQRSSNTGRLRRQRATESDNLEGLTKGLPDRDLLYPGYTIHNKAPNNISWQLNNGSISNHTINTDVVHANGLVEYDTHNLYGHMMAAASRDAMIARRPSVRPFIITRSTFSGSGTKTGNWLGDNESTWGKYRTSIRTMIASAAIYQTPMVGSDVCGFENNATESLCARWAALGAFSPFYRNHNAFVPLIFQEFYRWETVTESAKKAIDIRYRLLDYIYTAFYKQTIDGTPLINPIFFLYPSDQATWRQELQYFYGPALLVAPVTQENSTSVDVYFPDDVFYGWYTHEAIDSTGETRSFDVPLTQIPLFIRGGYILPLRTESGMTTTEVREHNFELIVALDRDGAAGGSLYLDDGESLVQEGTLEITFSFRNGTLRSNGTYDYETSARITGITVLDLAGGGNSTGTRVEVDEPLSRADDGFVIEV